MSKPPSAMPINGAELRPQRLDVAHLERGRGRWRSRARPPRSPMSLVIGAAGSERRRDMLGRQHARQHRVVRALDARHVDEAGRAADQRAAGEGQLRHRLVAALGDGARALGEPLAALEGVADQRMGLEALELLERRQIRVVVVEMHHEADRDHDCRRGDRGTSRRRSQLSSGQPKECCTSPRLCLAGSTCQSSFRPRPNFGGSRLAVERRTWRSAAWSGCRARLRANSVYLPRSSMPRVKRVLRLAVPADAHVAGGDAGHRALVVIEHLGRRQSPDRSRRPALRPCCASQRQTLPSETDKVAVVASSAAASRKFGSRMRAGSRSGK